MDRLGSLVIVINSIFMFQAKRNIAADDELIINSGLREDLDNKIHPTLCDCGNIPHKHFVEIGVNLFT
jgi:hypothetical protein